VVSTFAAFHYLKVDFVSGLLPFCITLVFTFLLTIRLAIDSLLEPRARSSKFGPRKIEIGDESQQILPHL